jgi:hypothetical protein
MKQKRNKPQISELGDKLQNQSSTSPGGNIDTSKLIGKKSDCSSGVCQVVWKPDALKR